MAFHPYLFFGGTCRAAFTRYQEVFGGELTLLTFADMPGDDGAPAGAADQIAHAALVLGDGLLMGSDDPVTVPFGGVHGMQVNATFADLDEARRVFDALADGGNVRMPAQATSWSPLFGMVDDRFGTPWMISADG